MILLENEKFIEFQVTDHLVDALEGKGLFLTQKEGFRRIQAGNKLSVLKQAVIEPFTGYFAGRVLNPMGAYSYSFSALPLALPIGRYSSIAGDVTMMGFGHPYTLISTNAALYEDRSRLIKADMMAAGKPAPRFFPAPQKAQPQVGNDVWVGENVKLARGVVLGDGCIIGANSLVTKSVPPYAIVGGNPAAIIKYRFSERTIAELQRIRWWQYRYSDICHLSLDRPEEFIGEIDNMVAGGTLVPWSPARVDVEAIVRSVMADAA